MEDIGRAIVGAHLDIIYAFPPLPFMFLASTITNLNIVCMC